MKIRIFLAIVVSGLLIAGCVISGQEESPEIGLKSSSTVATSTRNDFQPSTSQSTTPLPTYERKQASDLISEYLRTPPCSAPCFWGITPGKTTKNELNNIFLQFGLQTSELVKENLDYVDMRYSFENGLAIVLLLVVKDDLVQSFVVNITPSSSENEFAREWQAYSPDSLINTYGAPSMVNIGIDWGGPRTAFWLDVYFEKYDLIVEYSEYNTFTVTPSGDYQVCPVVDRVESIRIWMGFEPYHTPSGGVPLEEATYLTMESFVNLTTGNPGDACFIINKGVFGK
jgi:hypothetical protein